MEEEEQDVILLVRVYLHIVHQGGNQLKVPVTVSVMNTFEEIFHVPIELGHLFQFVFFFVFLH